MVLPAVKLRHGVTAKLLGADVSPLDPPAVGLMSRDRPGDPLGEVAKASFLKSSKLNIEGDVCALLLVVPFAESLAVGDVGPAAAAVRVHVVGLEALRDTAATEEPPVVLAPSARSRQDDRLVGPAEPTDGILRAAVDHDRANPTTLPTTSSARTAPIHGVWVMAVHMPLHTAPAMWPIGRLGEGGTCVGLGEAVAAATITSSPSAARVETFDQPTAPAAGILAECIVRRR